MLNEIGGDDHNAPDLQKALGKTIAKASIKDDCISLEFEDKSELVIWDDGQSCCENRYLHTDDNLNSIIGQRLVTVEQQSASSIETEYGDHEVSFLHIKTDQDTIVVETHNEHNGYYGGFWIRFDYKEPKGSVNA